MNIEELNQMTSKRFSRYDLLNHLFREVMKVDKARAQYVWGVLCGADLAKKLGIENISVIEFGVAGGNGLVCLEKISSLIEKIYSIKIDVYGFDAGRGLPKPVDYRDLPNLWGEGYFPMDVEKLKERINKAELILGGVKETVPQFLESNPAPIAFISFDLDLYTSTMEVFTLFDGDENLFLPRVHCFFDDIMGYTYSDFNGERLAISEFNHSHRFKKISKIYGLKYYVEDSSWVEQIYLLHIFNHKLYGENDGLLQTDMMSLEDS